MSMDINRLLEDLQKPDVDVKMLALNMLARYPYNDKMDEHLILGLYAEISQLCSHEENDVAFLAKKAQSQLIETFGDLNKRMTGSKNQTQESVFHLDDLNSPDADTRNRCILQMMGINYKEGYRPLVLLLGREIDPKVVATAIKALAEFGNAKTVKLLQVFLYFQDNRIRANAVEAIERLGCREDIVEMLPPLLTDPDNRVRANVIKAIGKFDEDEVLSHLGKMLQSEQVSQRSSAVYVLSQLKGNKILSLLNKASLDQDEGIRLQTVHALAQRSGNEVIPILRRLSQDMDIEVSEKAIQALEDFSRDKMVDLVDLKDLDHEDPPQNQPIEQDNIEEEKPVPKEPIVDQDEIDEELEALFISVGNGVYSLHKSSIIKEDRFLEFIYTVDKYNQNLDQRQIKNKDKNFISSLKKVFGGNFDEQIAIQKLEIAIEDAYLELGQKAYEIHVAEQLMLPGLEKKLGRITELFQVLNQPGS